MLLLQIARRMWRETDFRLLRKFAVNFGWNGMRAVNRFKREARRGNAFPAFLFISVTNACNLRCQGCWVVGNQPSTNMPPEKLDDIIRQGKRHGAKFFGILGGEPLLHKGLFDILGKHPDCYFQMFTNGTLLDDQVATELHRLGNVTPLISIEGNETVSDERRGGKEVFDRSMSALDVCRRHRLITGVATSVCQSNFDYVVRRAFLDNMVRQGVHYVWYYIYRPVGPAPNCQLALTEDQITGLRQFIVDMRLQVPLIIVDAYWDHEGKALCPAATGISHHINPHGDVEPCPPIQFARERIEDGTDLETLFAGSEFLRRFRELASDQSRGCILLENPQLLKEFMEQQNARDTTGRGTGFDELEAMSTLPGHHQPGKEVPEKSWVYRFAKKHWFFGFGAYG